jgi:surface polysaccharide O-acyltransferase-like enzyme
VAIAEEQGSSTHGDGIGPSSRAIDREYWLDVVRVVACLYVVVLHSTAPYLYELHKIPDRSWQIANWVNSSTRACVPLFFMTSGFLFFGERRPRLRHYIRILAATAFYSCIVISLAALTGHSDWDQRLLDVLRKPAFYHLWFMYPLLGVYVLAALVRVRELSGKQFAVLMLVAFIALNPGLSDLGELAGWDLRSAAQLDGEFVFYLLYAWMGALAARVPLTNPWLGWLCPLAYLTFSAAIARGTHVRSFEGGEFAGPYYAYTSVLVFGAAISIFLSIRIHACRLHFARPMVTFLARHSLVIYGLHVLALEFLTRRGYRDFSSPVRDISQAFLAALAASLVASVAIKRIDRAGWVS